ncbi:nucleotidyl transferase AbiEii/AbiGii toxin family protein [Caulobacter sp. Root343]|uniref:nucleotidyl transferase AbiEii/AbiGii toxin family protein n=1 Tax=Caulobacter sp. Root343 TaxID=1736520 RepID=UPI000701F0F8|nr:nucleotidyl transferase AbiEii/AbiGii toxin family protein [Caulobacter sp. Root343]KQV64064.1 hypothetical protein ASC70_19765 [Caulobacter sp. Root343]
MNLAFDTVITADAQTRAGLFAATAQRLGTTPRNVEKDFWVCWTLDALFNGLPAGAPRLLFKGGTSLSKGFGLIRRFSEDIDVTVFRDDLGVPASVQDLQAMSGRQRGLMLDRIATAGAAYIQGDLRQELWALVTEMARRTGATLADFGLDPDPNEAQTLLLTYPTVTPPDGYVLNTVKIESGAKSALDPSSVRIIKPYVDDDTPDLDLSVNGVVVVDATRTFWDKIIILHGLRRWFDIRQELRGGGQRVSRHYYDVHQLMQTEVAGGALADQALGTDAIAHARMFFNRPDFDLASAVAPTFALSPDGAMYDDLRRDYVQMALMIFGTPPAFEEVLASIVALEAQLNAVPAT